MKLIITSIVFGFLSIFVAGALDIDESMLNVFFIIGFFSPGIYTIEKIYEDIKKRENV